VEQLSSKLKELKLQRKIEKLKKKLKEFKSQEVASSSSSNEDTDASSEEVKYKKGGKGDKRLYNTTFNYDNLPNSSTFTSIPIGKPPHFDGTDYIKWSYSMRIHLILLSLSVWNIVCRC
jgi:hypothetical protein